LIFLSLGTHRQPFDRALDLVIPFARDRDRLVVQYGHTPPRLETPDVEWHQYLPLEAMVSHMTASEAFICHAGVGSILTALSAGVVPVVLPRQIPRREHVDSHQEAFARELSARGSVVGVFAPESDITGAVAEARALRGRRPAPAPGRLVAAVGEVLAGL
jgi:UDP-N-acetylglucosamine--N-acetylmuramyl-(pentapeptide) pyrophosphoryl-undecaprenol N-acetylglucosamine transferase